MTKVPTLYGFLSECSFMKNEGQSTQRSNLALHMRGQTKQE